MNITIDSGRSSFTGEGYIQINFLPETAAERLQARDLEHQLSALGIRSSGSKSTNDRGSGFAVLLEKDLMERLCKLFSTVPETWGPETWVQGQSHPLGKKKDIGDLILECDKRS